MNPDFTVERLQEGHAFLDVLNLSYKGVGIAKFVQVLPTEKHPNPPSLDERLQEYLNVYGYLAEHRRRWNLKDYDPGVNWVNWKEEMRVDPWAQ